MNDFEKYLQSFGLSKATVKHYNAQALDFITWCDMQHVEAEDAGGTEVTGWLQHLQGKGQQNKTRGYQLIVLKHFFNWQISRGQRQDNPARHIKIRGAQHTSLYPIFTKQELESLYHGYVVPGEDDARNKHNWFANYRLSRQRNKAMLSLMVYQGLCTDEVNRLAVSDIKLREGSIFIAGTRKSNERLLELKPHQVMELMEYQLTVRVALQKLSSHQSQLYFLPVPAAGQKTITNNDGINTWKRLSAEIKGSNKKFINFLQVRASVITHWLKQHNLRQAQYMAGHKYVSSTESYLVNQMEDLQSDIEQFHPIG